MSQLPAPEIHEWLKAPVTGVLCLLLSLGLLYNPPAARAAQPREEEAGRVVVGSKNFAENRLLGEMFAQLLEAHTDLAVERRLGLAGSDICFAAIQGGELDVYPEYTGTALVSLLGMESSRDPRFDLFRLRTQLHRLHKLTFLSPLGFENAYEIAVRAEVAQREGLRTISDLARVAPQLQAAFGFEFMQRPDGLPGLTDAYQLEFAGQQPVQQALKYQLAGQGDIDVLDVYTTDGRNLLHDLVILEDDKNFFPPYQAAPLVREDLLARHPRAVMALELLAGALDAQHMRRLNRRLQESGAAESDVARQALNELGLLEESAGDVSASAPRAGFLAFVYQQRGMLAQRTLEHIGLSLAALLAGTLVALTAALLLERRRRIAEPVIRAVGLTQTIPSIALLAFMVPLLGIGVLPALTALWIYSIFPVLRAAYTGVRDADPQAVQAATALGMTDLQVLTQIRLPLAVPVIMAGVRTAGVITVGTATLAAFIGAGGLGEPIVTGLQLSDSRRILAGAIPAAALAFAADALLALLEKALRPRGLD
ncbi:MAG TPA: glycine betaine ABC transporter substrate-binding protein [Acidobacteriota bacterium]|nr:glycine betaine ABC transporter substrate-binding protein [Acidobacteriota bacterium]